MGRSDLHIKAHFWEFWYTCFFNTSLTPYLVALTRIRATKTRSKKSCTPLSYGYSESWVRKDSAGYTKKISHFKNFDDGAIYEKVPFFTDFLVRTPKKSIRLVYPQFRCHRPSTSCDIASLNRYNPKSTPKSTFCHRFGLQHPPKSAYPKNFPWFLVFFFLTK